jgi:hypothetical protein
MTDSLMQVIDSMYRDMIIVLAIAIGLTVLGVLIESMEPEDRRHEGEDGSDL